MKKTIIFLLILIASFSFILVSCINTNKTADIKINFKGDFLTINTSRMAFDDVEIEGASLSIFKEGSIKPLETINITPEELKQGYFEFNRLDFSGNYTFKLEVTYIPPNSKDNQQVNLVHGEKTIEIANGKNEFSIITEFYDGMLDYKPFIHDMTGHEISYDYSVKLFKASDPNAAPLENSFSDDGILLEPIPAGVYNLEVIVKEKNTENIIWQTDKTPYLVQIYPGNKTTIIFDPLSTNKVGIKYPWILPVKNLKADFVVNTTSVEISWDYIVPDGHNEIYQIYKKTPAGNFRKIAEISSPYDGIINDDHFIWTDNVEENTEQAVYAVNVIKYNLESGAVEVTASVNP